MVTKTPRWLLPASPGLESAEEGVWIIKPLGGGGWRIVHAASMMRLTELWYKRDAIRLRKLLPPIGPDPNADYANVVKTHNLFRELGVQPDPAHPAFYVVKNWPVGS